MYHKTLVEWKQTHLYIKMKLDVKVMASYKRTSVQAH